MACDSEEVSAYSRGLAVIRRRRWYLWGLILIYLPLTVPTLQVTQSYRVVGIELILWLILLCIAVTLTASAQCPRCGNTFHMKNSTLGYGRKCRYCGLHLCSDKKSAYHEKG